MWLDVHFCFFIVMTPKATNPPPIARIKKSAGRIRAQTWFTELAYMNRMARKTNAIPVIVSPFIVSISR